MPYYLFKISQADAIGLVKQIELLQTHDAFKAASKAAKQQRAEQPLAGFTYKVMFADNQLEAEEKLQEKRKKPVLMEHER
jgi:hypothetical protein